MEYVIPILRLSVSALSMLGILVFLYDKSKTEPAFLPILTVSLVTLFTYLGGMLGLLWPSVIIIHILGLSALCYATVRIIRKKLNVLPLLRSPALWFFAALCVYFVIHMRGRLVLHVDNFSHWATVIKEICLTDAFPATGSAVTFRNYTPGSAAFIYFICSTVGFTEGTALMAQGFFIAAALSVILCKAKFGKPVTLVSLVITSVISVSIPELSAASLHYYNFLVDGLIAHFTVASGIIAYYYRDDLKRCIAILIPVTSVLTVIKTSARFFAIMITLFVLAMFAKKIFTKGCFKKPRTYLSLGGIAALAVSQLLTPSLWNTYIENAFTDAALSDNKFPSTVGGLVSSLISKDGAYLRQIAAQMQEKLTDLTDPVIAILLFAEIFSVCVLITVLAIKERPGVILPVFILANLTYIVYVFELFIMYGFIFPEEEATILASFYRYLSTGVSITVTVLLTGGIYRISGIAKKTPRVITSLAVVAVTLFFCVSTLGESTIQVINPATRDNTAVRTEERVKYAEIYADIQPLVERGSSVIVFTNDTSFFAACLPGYELCTKNYSMMRPADRSDPEYARKRIEGVEYVVAPDAVNDFYSFTSEMGIEVEGTPSMVYKVTADGGKKTLTALH